MIEDAETFFTHKGHVVLMVLIKLGGPNIIAFGSLLALLARFGVGVRQHDVIEDFVNRGSILGSRGTSAGSSSGASASRSSAPSPCSCSGRADCSRRRATGCSSACSSPSAPSTMRASPCLRVDWRTPRVSGSLAGPLGRHAARLLRRVGHGRHLRPVLPESLRDRMKNPVAPDRFPDQDRPVLQPRPRRLGAVAYLLLESGAGGTLDGMGWTGRITTAFFQSATRTSGFNTVDIGGIGTPMLFLLIILMFIGASSSSTGGGIKTSTFAVVFADLIGTIRGLQHPHLFKRTIGKTLRSRGGILMFFLLFNLVGTFALTVTEPHLLQDNQGFLNLLFEQVSALGTVGLSTGITADISPIGRGILIASMIIGRVGTLTVTFALFVQSSAGTTNTPKGTRWWADADLAPPWEPRSPRTAAATPRRRRSRRCSTTSRIAMIS